jgi:hypothetical protein
MPIRFVDRAATVVGRVATTLADVSPNFDGTFTTAPARTGTISAQMQDHSAQLSGIFQSNANRVGTIGTVLGNHVASFLGGGAVQHSGHADDDAALDVPACVPAGRCSAGQLRKR